MDQLTSIVNKYIVGKDLNSMESDKFESYLTQVLQTLYPSDDARKISKRAVADSAVGDGFMPHEDIAIRALYGSHDSVAYGNQR